MDSQNPIRVMIVDDHAVVRSGLGAFLLTFDDLELVGEAEDGEEALQRCAEANPDVILMDLVMPGMDGAQATAAIRKRCPHVQVVALTSYREGELVEGALQAGAISYLLKNTSADALADAIRQAYAGRSTLSPEATEALIRATRRPATPDYDLTPREKEVLSLMAEGKRNAEIADELYLSVSTVKFHVSSILSKLHAESRTEAVSIALQEELV